MRKRKGFRHASILPEVYKIRLFTRMNVLGIHRFRFRKNDLCSRRIEISVCLHVHVYFIKNNYMVSILNIV